MLCGTISMLDPFPSAVTRSSCSASPPFEARPPFPPTAPFRTETSPERFVADATTLAGPPGEVATFPALEPSPPSALSRSARLSADALRFSAFSALPPGRFGARVAPPTASCVSDTGPLVRASTASERTTSVPGAVRERPAMATARADTEPPADSP
jgi:hypothetical protein